jgi:hypothetical protein
MAYSNPALQSKYQADWVRRRREAWLAANGPCRRCGSSERLEVDHVDPTAKTSHRIWSWSAERREAELRKCQVLCRACHKEKTRAHNSRLGGAVKSRPVKLAPETVLEIHRRALAGEVHRALAEEFGVVRSTVSYIADGTLWGWLTRGPQLALFDLNGGAA